MKTSTLFCAFLLIAATTFGQEEPAPDYSQATLLRVLAETSVEAEAEPRIRFEDGALRFQGFGTRWAFLYTPMLPLAGSRPVVSQVLPDAFSLTNTPFATLPHQYRDGRELNEELMRIERMDRSRMRVTVRSGSQ
jgi:hypothetical protein